MSEEHRFEQLRQAGFTRVEQWNYRFDQRAQQALLAVVANDPQTVALK